MVTRSTIKRVAVMLLVIAMPIFTFAKANGRGSSITIDTPNGYASATLTVTDSEDNSYTATFRGGQPVVFNLSDMPGDAIANGQYSYSVTFAPSMSDSVKKQLASARAAGDDKAAAKVLKANGVTLHAPVTGAFLVVNGSIVDTNATEADANDARLDTGNNSTTTTTTATGGSLSGPAGRFTPDVQDQVIPDDLIVQGSACVGLDCVDGESFGFDTIRMKENNLRIKAEDTSTSTGFPTTDWQLTFNDSASGGLNKFSVDDVTNAKTPFTVEANAPNNSLYVDDTGRIGIQQNLPVLDIHVTTGNTPALRLEQTNAGGFTAQTWDIGANEANFFVRDVTGGSRLPFRIRPGAPTSSLDVSASGKVGVGTASPAANLDVRGANAHLLLGNSTTDYLGPAQTAYGASTGTEHLFFGVQTGLAFLGSITNTNLAVITNNTTKMTITSAGNVGIGNTAPTSQLVITNGASSSSINAGSAQFTVSSSRTFKDNIEPMEVPDILKKIESVPVVTYDFKNNGPKDVMGLIAEDFHKVFERGDEKYIDGHEVQMALWMAVQQLTAQNKALTDRLSTLEKQLTTEQQQ